MYKIVTVFILAVFLTSCRSSSEMYLAKGIISSEDVLIKINVLDEAFRINEEWKDTSLYIINNEKWIFAKVQIINYFITEHPGFLCKEDLINSINSIKDNHSDAGELEYDGAWSDCLKWLINNE